MACILSVLIFNDTTEITTYAGIAVIIAAGVWASVVTKRAKDG